jgi:predicted nucleic acid-binding protein
MGRRTEAPHSIDEQRPCGRSISAEPGPYEILAPRAWQLRHNLSIYDAGYVALAEVIEATLVKLDRRIGGTPGLRCTIATP